MIDRFEIENNIVPFLSNLGSGLLSEIENSKDSISYGIIDSAKYVVVINPKNLDGIFELKINLYKVTRQKLIFLKHVLVDNKIINIDMKNIGDVSQREAIDKAKNFLGKNIKKQLEKSKEPITFTYLHEGGSRQVEIIPFTDKKSGSSDWHVFDTK